MKPLAAIDLDGTLCDDDHRKHLLPDPIQVLRLDGIDRERAYEEYHQLCIEDRPIEIACKLTRLCHYTHSIIIVTSRPSRFYLETQAWLKQQHIKYNEILMRPHLNFMNSPELKRQLLFGSSAVYKGFPKGNNIALDDRQDVLDMWKLEGFTTIKIDK